MAKSLFALTLGAVLPQDSVAVEQTKNPWWLIGGDESYENVKQWDGGGDQFGYRDVTKEYTFHDCKVGANITKQLNPTPKYRPPKTKRQF